MAKNYNDYNYFENRTDVTDIFDTLDSYLNYCRFELLEYDPSHFSVKGNHHPQFRGYLSSKRPRKPYLGKNPRNGYNSKPRHEQNFSR